MQWYSYWSSSVSISVKCIYSSDKYFTSAKIKVDAWFFSFSIGELCFLFFFFYFTLKVMIKQIASILISYASILPCIVLYTSDHSQQVLLYLHAIGMTIIIVFLFNQPMQETQQSELYGLRNLLVNLELPPKSAWFNMGLWDRPNLNYSQACQNLVREVTEQCAIQPNSSILGKMKKRGLSCASYLSRYHH